LLLLTWYQVTACIFNTPGATKSTLVTQQAVAAEVLQQDKEKRYN
jgi:hypothetical protein